MPTIQVYVAESVWSTVVENARGKEISATALVGRLIDWYAQDPLRANRRQAIQERSRSAGAP